MPIITSTSPTNGPNQTSGPPPATLGGQTNVTAQQAKQIQQSGGPTAGLTITSTPPPPTTSAPSVQVQTASPALPQSSGGGGGSPTPTPSPSPIGTATPAPIEVSEVPNNAVTATASTGSIVYTSPSGAQYYYNIPGVSQSTITNVLGTPITSTQQDVASNTAEITNLANMAQINLGTPATQISGGGGTIGLTPAQATALTLEQTPIVGGLGVGLPLSQQLNAQGQANYSQYLSTMMPGTTAAQIQAQIFPTSVSSSQQSGQYNYILNPATNTLTYNPSSAAPFVYGGTSYPIIPAPNLTTAQLNALLASGSLAPISDGGQLYMPGAAFAQGGTLTIQVPTKNGEQVLQFTPDQLDAIYQQYVANNQITTPTIVQPPANAAEAGAQEVLYGGLITSPQISYPQGWSVDSIGNLTVNGADPTPPQVKQYANIVYEYNKANPPIPSINASNVLTPAEQANEAAAIHAPGAKFTINPPGYDPALTNWYAILQASEPANAPILTNLKSVGILPPPVTTPPNPYQQFLSNAVGGIANAPVGGIPGEITFGQAYNDINAGVNNVRQFLGESSVINAAKARSETNPYISGGEQFESTLLGTLSNLNNPSQPYVGKNLFYQQMEQQNPAYTNTIPGQLGEATGYVGAALPVAGVSLVAPEAALLGIASSVGIGEAASYALTGNLQTPTAVLEEAALGAVSGIASKAALALRVAGTSDMAFGDALAKVTTGEVASQIGKNIGFTAALGGFVGGVYGVLNPASVSTPSTSQSQSSTSRTANLQTLQSQVGQQQSKGAYQSITNGANQIFNSFLIGAERGGLQGGQFGAEFGGEFDVALTELQAVAGSAVHPLAFKAGLPAGFGAYTTASALASGASPTQAAELGVLTFATGAVLPDLNPTEAGGAYRSGEVKGVTFSVKPPGIVQNIADVIVNRPVDVNEQVRLSTSLLKAGLPQEDLSSALDLLQEKGLAEGAFPNARLPYNPSQAVTPLFNVVYEAPRTAYSTVTTAPLDPAELDPFRKGIAQLAGQEGHVVGGSTSVEAQLPAGKFRQGVDTDVYVRGKGFGKNLENLIDINGNPIRNIENIPNAEAKGLFPGATRIGSNQGYVISAGENGTLYAEKNLQPPSTLPGESRMIAQTADYTIWQAGDGKIYYKVEGGKLTRDISTDIRAELDNAGLLRLPEGYSKVIDFTDKSLARARALYSELGIDPERVQINPFSHDSHQVIWDVETSTPLVDISLRNQPADKIVEIEGIKYRDYKQVMADKGALLRLEDPTSPKSIKALNDIRLVQLAEEDIAENRNPLGDLVDKAGNPIRNVLDATTKPTDTIATGKGYSILQGEDGATYYQLGEKGLSESGRPLKATTGIAKDILSTLKEEDIVASGTTLREGGKATVGQITKARLRLGLGAPEVPGAYVAKESYNYNADVAKKTKNQPFKTVTDVLTQQKSYEANPQARPEAAEFSLTKDLAYAIKNINIAPLDDYSLILKGRPLESAAIAKFATQSPEGKESVSYGSTSQTIVSKAQRPGADDDREFTTGEKANAGVAKVAEITNDFMRANVGKMADLGYSKEEIDVVKSGKDLYKVGEGKGAVNVAKNVITGDKLTDYHFENEEDAGYSSSKSSNRLGLKETGRLLEAGDGRAIQYTEQVIRKANESMEPRIKKEASVDALAKKAAVQREPERYYTYIQYIKSLPEGAPFNAAALYRMKADYDFLAGEKYLSKRILGGQLDDKITALADIKLAMGKITQDQYDLITKGSPEKLLSTLSPDAATNIKATIQENTAPSGPTGAYPVIPFAGLGAPTQSQKQQVGISEITTGAVSPSASATEFAVVEGTTPSAYSTALNSVGGRAAEQPASPAGLQLIDPVSLGLSSIAGSSLPPNSANPASLPVSTPSMTSPPNAYNQGNYYSTSPTLPPNSYNIQGQYPSATPSSRPPNTYTYSTNLTSPSPSSPPNAYYQAIGSTSPSPQPLSLQPSSGIGSTSPTYSYTVPSYTPSSRPPSVYSYSTPTSPSIYSPPNAYYTPGGTPPPPPTKGKPKPGGFAIGGTFPAKQPVIKYVGEEPSKVGYNPSLIGISRLGAEEQRLYNENPLRNRLEAINARTYERPEEIEEAFEPLVVREQAR